MKIIDVRDNNMWAGEKVRRLLTETRLIAIRAFNSNANLDGIDSIVATPWAASRFQMLPDFRVIPRDLNSDDDELHGCSGTIVGKLGESNVDVFRAVLENGRWFRLHSGNKFVEVQILWD